MIKTLQATLLSLLPLLLPAQTAGGGKLDVLSVEQGLSQGFVSGIVQDDDGFLWFATKNGLNRYDGYEFKIFKNNPFDSLSLHSNGLDPIAAVGDFLVIGLDADHFNFFERRTQRFFPFPKFFTLKNASIERFFAEGKNAVWVAHSNNGVLRVARISWAADVAERLTRGEKPENLFKFEEFAPPDRGWLDAQPTRDGKKIWLLSETLLTERDLATGQTRAVPLPPDFSNNIVNHFARIMPDSSGAVWVHLAKWIFRFDGRSGWQSFALPFFADHFLSFADHYNGLLWVGGGTEVFGLDCSPPPAGAGVKIVHRLAVGVFIRSGFSDRFGNLWLGTDARGVRKFNPKRSIFQNYLPGVSVYCPPVFDGKKHVLLGDLRRREFSWEILDLSSGQTRRLEDFNIRPDFSMRATAVSNGKFWLFPFLETKEFQLVQLDPATGSKAVFPAPPEVKLDFYILRVDEAAGEIWMFGIWQFIRFEVATGRFTIFDINQEKMVEILAAERSADGAWWVGGKGGLLKFECKNDGLTGFKLSKIAAETGNRNSLQTNDIKSLLFDPTDPAVLWIGTNGQGLSRLDLKKNSFSHFTTRNGLPDDVVYGVLADDEQPRKLWLSTNRGLARFSPETLVFQYFTTFDGLPDNEFNTLSAFKSAASGALLFGGVNGLTVFRPRDLALGSQLPEVRFSDLKINGVSVGPRDSAAVLAVDLAFTRQIELPFSKNNLFLSFASTDFTSPERNQYAFYLEGAEHEWAHRGFEHSAQYLNLSPGNYTFWVKTANSNGVWNEQPIALKIKIGAPWYRTWWAYFAYFALLAGAVFWIYRAQLRQKLEHAEALRLKSLDEFKSRFFTNITHEFRTPLTVILGMAERLTADDGRAAAGGNQPLNLIKRNGENLLRLINQILDLAKLESNSLKINYVQGDVLAYLRYIAESLHSLANAQNLLLRVESDKAKIEMDYDPERLLQVIHNLLSNAIKFTPSGGRVVLRADVLENWLKISVSDTGIGIPSDDLPQVFDRFFQAKNQEKSKSNGSGIGLSLTRELVRAMGGEISAQSEVGRGTTFVVQLPILKNAPRAELDLNLEQYFGKNSTENLRRKPAESFSKNESNLLKNNLLIIEDNPDVVEYLTACLHEKYQLDFAFNGRAGIEKALESVPDLIVSDVMMPEKDGFEVCDFLKNDERTSHIPIVLLTAKADVESRIAGLRRGADVYLAKPFYEEELLLQVQNLLEIRQKLRERYAVANYEIKTSSDTPNLKPAAQPPKPENLEDVFLKKFRAVLEANFADPEFSLDTICRELAMSRTQIYRKLVALTGRSAVEHIQNFRLEKARALLLAGGMNVSEVAFASGFNDPKYFSRVFSETYGLAPSQILET